MFKASPLVDRLPRTAPSIDRLGEERNKEEPSRQKKNEQRRDIEGQPPYIPPELGFLVFGPLGPCVALFHEKSHEAVDAPCLIEEDGSVFCDVRPEKTTYHSGVPHSSIRLVDGLRAEVYFGSAGIYTKKESIGPRGGPNVYHPFLFFAFLAWRLRLLTLRTP